MKNQEIINWANSELELWEPDLVKINDGVSECIGLMHVEELDRRKYYHSIPKVTQFIEQVKQVKKLEESKKFYHIFKDYSDKQESAMRFKEAIIEDLNQIHKCAKCVCKNCILDCPFKACFECNHSEYVFNCNREIMCVIKGIPNILMYDNDHNVNIPLAVLGRLVNVETKKQYLLTAEIGNPDNSHLHEYVKHINGDFDLVQLTEQELDEVYEEFLKLGVSD